MIGKRRYRSKIGRAKLYLSHNGQCYYCKKSLETSWHVDHMIPWSKGGATVDFNLRPSCPSCNLKKGVKIMDMETNYRLSPSQYETMSHFDEDFPRANTKEIRLPQKGMYNCVKHRLVTLKLLSATGFLPTGVGKSDVVRMIAQGLCGGLVYNKEKSEYKSIDLSKPFAGVWVFSPSSELKEQLKTDNVEEYFDRIGCQQLSIPFMTRDDIESESFRNGCVLDSYTTQFLTAYNQEGANVDNFITQAKRIIRDTGKAPIVIFDESQLFGTDKEWGRQAKRLQDAKIPIILITGTPIRSDDMGIPGFELIPIKVPGSDVPLQIERNKTTTTKISNDPLVVKVKTDLVRVSKYHLRADYEYTYERAWNDGIILRPNPMWLDGTKCATLEDEEDDFCVVSKVPISEMSRRSADRILRDFLLDDRTISTAVTACINSLNVRKFKNKDCCAIITTLSDMPDDVSEDDDLANLHAEKIKNEFKLQAPHLRVMIVTSASVDGKYDNNTLKNFKEQKYDVLIVKTMGTVGFNYKYIKTVCSLSNYRTLAALIQFANRGCRLLQFDDGTKWHQYYDLILPKDKGIKALLGQFVDQFGFVLEKTEVVEQGEEVEKVIEKDDKVKTQISFEDHNISWDSELPRNESDAAIEKMRRALPELACTLSGSQLLAVYESYRLLGVEKKLDEIPAWKFERQMPLEDLNEKEDNLRLRARTLVKQLNLEITKLLGGGYSPKLYGSIEKKIWTSIKRKCRFSSATKLKNLAGIDNFQKLLDACNDLIQHIKTWPESDSLDYNYKLDLWASSRRI